MSILCIYEGSRRLLAWMKVAWGMGVVLSYIKGVATSASQWEPLRYFLDNGPKKSRR